MAGQLGMETVNDIRKITAEVTRLDGEVKKTEKTATRLNRTIKQGANDAARSTRRAKTNNDQFNQSMQTSINTAGMVASAVTGIATAISSEVKNAWRELQAEMKKTEKVAKDIVVGMQTEASGLGATTEGAKFRHITMRNLGRGPMTAAELRGVTGAFAGTARDATANQVDLMQQAAQNVRLTGMEGGDLNEVTEMAGAFVNQGMDVNTAMSLAFMTKQRAGKNARSVSRYVEYALAQGGAGAGQDIAALLLSPGSRQGISEMMPKLRQGQERGLQGQSLIEYVLAQSSERDQENFRRQQEAIRNNLSGYLPGQANAALRTNIPLAEEMAILQVQAGTEARRIETQAPMDRLQRLRQAKEERRQVENLADPTVGGSLRTVLEDYIEAREGSELAQSPERQMQYGNILQEQVRQLKEQTALAKKQQQQEEKVTRVQNK